MRISEIIPLNQLKFPCMYCRDIQITLSHSKASIISTKSTLKLSFSLVMLKLETRINDTNILHTLLFSFKPKTTQPISIMKFGPTIIRGVSRIGERIYELVFVSRYISNIFKFSPDSWIYIATRNY